MLGPAKQRAKELDEDFAVTKKLKGPLHGVPVSLPQAPLTSNGLKNWLDQHQGAVWVCHALYYFTSR